MKKTNFDLHHWIHVSRFNLMPTDFLITDSELHHLVLCSKIMMIILQRGRLQNNRPLGEPLMANVDKLNKLPVAEDSSKYQSISTYVMVCQIYLKR